MDMREHIAGRAGHYETPTPRPAPNITKKVIDLTKIKHLMFEN
jgi:hypothetical protein